MLAVLPGTDTRRPEESEHDEHPQRAGIDPPMKARRGHHQAEGRAPFPRASSRNRTSRPFIPPMYAAARARPPRTHASPRCGHVANLAPNSSTANRNTWRHQAPGGTGSPPPAV